MGNNLLQISDVNAQDALGQLPLHVAADRGNANMAYDLLFQFRNTNNIHRQGTILNSRCSKGQTALHRATLACSTAVVGLLLNAGADPNCVDKAGHTALHIASRHALAPVIEQLLSDPRCDINMAIKTGVTPLFYATGLGNEWIVRLLVQRGADANRVCGPKNATPLQEAVWKNYHAIIEFLISSGSDVNAKNVKGGSLLHDATANGDQATMLLLLRGGADVNAKDRSALTPLHFAARSGNESAVWLLISNGAIRNGKGYRCATLSDLARWMGCHKIVDMVKKARQG